jgi:hypothetical protein
MRKNPFKFKVDERDLNNLHKVCTILYIITIYSLMGVISYRQFVLHQPHEEWDDIAIIMTVNVIVFIGSLLYIGGSINPKKIKLRKLIAGYIGFVLFGLVFTIFKYTVLLGQELSLVQVWDYFLTILKITGILAIVLGILAYLGSRRIEKQIE